MSNVEITVRAIVSMAIAVLSEEFTEPGGDRRQLLIIETCDEMLLDMTGRDLMTYLPAEAAEKEEQRRYDACCREEFCQLMADRMETEQETMILQMEEELGDDGDYYV